MRAAWMLSQHPECGEHLAKIYEKQGLRARAIELYAQAASVGIDLGSDSGGSASQTSSRKALERLVGVGAAEVEKHLAAGRTTLVDERTVKLPRLVSGAARANVTALVGADGRLGGVRFMQGDERLRAPLATVNNLKAPALQPDDRTMTFVRTGVVGCSASACTLILMRPADTPQPPASVQ